ncbi:MAG: caspase family protein [Proteobacteria bacterium]|nr:caspase family protein [Desulfobulbaceae bacterium]MBU4153388.1 caspase family protein [Pseudomonadota bacterium]MDP2105018.1 caspase family protein [Desulfobulbaceae bacterium]
MAKKALLVGINDYKGISDLRGCINDVTNMRDILKTYLGFTNRDIRVLVDSRATKANIVSRLQTMVSTAKSGDFLVFHFSGHGSQIRDRNGDELEDQMDELICPYDMDWDGTFITDDSLNSIFSKLPKGVLLEVFLDSCHSGTGLRDINFGRPANLGPEHTTLDRFLAPPADIECRLEGEEDDLKSPRSFRSANRSTVHHILWAGCKDNQTSADAFINNSYNGAFTYFFCKHMRASGGTLSRKELLSRVRQSLRNDGYSQIPQLECEATVRNARSLTATEKAKSKK